MDVKLKLFTANPYILVMNFENKTRSDIDA